MVGEWEEGREGHTNEGKEGEGGRHIGREEGRKEGNEGVLEPWLYRCLGPQVLIII